MSANIAVILTDSSRKIMWVNDGFTSITGYTLSEVIGKKPSLLQGPGSEKDVIQRIRFNLENEISFKDCITNYRKNGEPYQCKLVVHPVFADDGNLTNFIAFEVDGDKVNNEEIYPLLNIDNKYRSSSLKGAEEMRLYMSLVQVVESESLYLDPELSLKTVADHLHTNTKYLSQVVNHHAGCNFQKFINQYRIKRVQDMITDNDHKNLTLFGIALQCGFKNKSTFYKVFKDITNMTPKTYLREQGRK
jgi:PAS domain S-box-containing protein